jgi:hypothetical protein
MAQRMTILPNNSDLECAELRNECVYLECDSECSCIMNVCTLLSWLQNISFVLIKRDFIVVLMGFVLVLIVPLMINTFLL